MGSEIKDHLSRGSRLEELKSFFEAVEGQPVRDDRRDVQTVPQERSTLLPRPPHLAAKNPDEVRLLEDHVGAGVHRDGTARQPQQRHPAAVAEDLEASPYRRPEKS